jgi:hypothetical protein
MARVCRSAALLPHHGAQQAWQQDHHEYSFAVSATTSMDTVRLIADEHAGGGLDWHAFAATVTAEKDADIVATSLHSAAIPVPASFPGMPNSRWWTFEDGNFDLGQVDANPADLARMAILEFALVFGNDFFVVPVRLAYGSLCRTTALLVTDNFNV